MRRPSLRCRRAAAQRAGDGDEGEQRLMIAFGASAALIALLAKAGHRVAVGFRSAGRRSDADRAR